MKLYIKNMVCRRCIMVVRDLAVEHGIEVRNLNLGELETVDDDIPADILDRFDAALKHVGFERFDNKKSVLIEKTKTIIIDRIHHSEGELNVNWSQIIADNLHYEYNYISNLFSSLEGITLEQFIIRQKIERVKELLFYEELNLAEIAWQMGYNSSAYLSNQFKRVCGMTPGQFRKALDKSRKSLDNL